MSYLRGGSTHNYNYHRMNRSDIEEGNGDTSPSSPKYNMFRFIRRWWKRPTNIPVWVVDCFVSNILRLSIYLYWRVAGRLPKFLGAYSIDNEKVKCLNQELEQTISRTNHEIGRLNGDVKHYEELNCRMEKDIESIRKREHTLEAEKQDALTRLSELVSVKLRDNNPNIVDLNDQCRPTKLAEMFSELYDNEWTSAYSVLEAPFGEKRAIVVLLDIVMEAYGFCEKRVAVPWNVLTEWFLDMSLPGAQQTSKWLKDSRKANIRKHVCDVGKNYEQELSRQHGEDKFAEILLDKDMKQYIIKCVELCLLMVTTDPPVILDCPGWPAGLRSQENAKITQEFNVDKQHEQGDEEMVKPDSDRDEDKVTLFNKELFKEYTIRGTYLDYVVWPALFLHKGGPMLSKGIAQGRKDQHEDP